MMKTTKTSKATNPTSKLTTTNIYSSTEETANEYKQTSEKKLAGKKAKSNFLKKPTRVAAWNIRSTLNEDKMTDIAYHMQKLDIEIAVLSESRLPESGRKEHAGVTFIWTGHPTKHEAGVAIALRDKALKAWQEAGEPMEATSPRILKISLSSYRTRITIIGVYAPTNNDPKGSKIFYEEVQKLITTVPKRDLLLLLGDWNACLGRQKVDTKGLIGPHTLGEHTRNGGMLRKFSMENDLVVASTTFEHKAIHLGTHYHAPTKKWRSIDHILIGRRYRSSVKDVRVYRSANVNSDHLPVVATIKLKLKLTNAKRAKPLPKLNYDQMTRNDEFSKAMEAAWHSRNPSDDPNKEWNALRNTLLTTANEALPDIQYKKPWIRESPEAKNAVDSKRKAWVDYLASRTDAKLQEYRRARNRATEASRKTREEWLTELARSFEEAAQKSNIVEAFKLLDKLTGTTRRSPIPGVRDLNGEDISKAEQIDKWREYFDKLLNPAPTTSPIKKPPMSSTMKPPQLPVLPPDHPPTEKEIETALKELKRRKAPGPDQIAPELLKYGGPGVVKWLTHLFQLVWNTETIPQDWKDATIVPIFKKGDRRLCNNYRGISLLSIPGKVFTRVLLNRFKDSVDTLLMELQSGFRKGRRTTDHIFNIKLLSQKSIEFQRPIYACFIDIKKAYDSVNRNKIPNVLGKYCIPQKIVRLIQDLHDGTRSRVRINREESEPFDTKSGLRQGCVLAPILFNIVLDHVLRQALNQDNKIEILVKFDGKLQHRINEKMSITERLSCLAYADDIALLCTSIGGLQDILNSLDTACAEVGLSISEEKSKVMAWNSNQTMEIYLNNTILEQVNEFRYLGSIISSDANDTSDIKARIETASNSYNKLRNSVWKRKEISVKTKMQLYRSIILPTLLYGCESWTLPKTSLKPLEKFQMKCLRNILGLSLWDKKSNEEIRKMTNQPKVESLMRYRRQQWLGHISRMEDSRLPKRILFGQLKGRRRKKQRKRWSDGVLEDHEKMSLTNWYDTARDRKKWRQVIKQQLRRDSEEDFAPKKQISAPRTLPCSRCDKKFVHAGALSVHMETAHPTEKDIKKCDICNQIFKRLGYATHRKACEKKNLTLQPSENPRNKVPPLQRGQETVQCPHCGKSLKEKGYGPHVSKCKNNANKVPRLTSTRSCRYCQQTFKAQGIGRHESRCPSRPSSEDPTS